MLTNDMHGRNSHGGISRAYSLNQKCLCQTLDQAALREAVDAELINFPMGAAETDLLGQPFANQAVFIPSSDLLKMQSAVQAIERAAALPGFQSRVLSGASSAAAVDPGPLGVFMGYDFHLTPFGPQLIEVNTNAGGAFLNAVLAKAQTRCCSSEKGANWVEGFERAVIRMFEREWRLQRDSDRPRSIAIVDDDPESQYLYSEFRLAAALLQRNGISAYILAPHELRFAEGRLWHGSEPIDLIYNRLVDFALEEQAHHVLRRAWFENGAVITPHPRSHALLANKQNLIFLSDSQLLQEWGLGAEDVALLLDVVPRTQLVTARSAETLWQARRQLFFKPLTGHGSKGAYRGSKLTKGTFATLLGGRHVAQEYIPPSERAVKVDGQEQLLKVDVRLYTYNGELIIPAARLYRGQTTNFRTHGGGFAPVFVAE